LTETNKEPLFTEMEACGVDAVDCLHITSWDTDHCTIAELEELLAGLRPTRIECPGYDPSSDNAKACRKLIREYQAVKRNSNRPVTIEYVTPEYINGLVHAERLGFNNVFYHPKHIDPDCSNDNSTVNLFRRGSFNVLSLGDVESVDLSARLRRDKYLRREVDVMILAHHGANNGFTNKRLLQHIEPHVAICSSNWDNQHGHPTQEIRDLLYEQGVILMTTKTGDVIVKSVGRHDGAYEVVNLKAGSTEVSSVYKFTSKKSILLSHNEDTIRQLYSPAPSYRFI
jgi:competence protein ComEC